MTFAALQPLADRAALFSSLRQGALRAAVDDLGEHRWDADSAAGTLIFTAEADPSRQLTARTHLIATLAPGPRSLLWAWAHPQGDAQGVATQLRAYGEQHGLVELTSAELPFPSEQVGALDDDGLARWMTGAAKQIGAVAEEITGLAPYFVAPVGTGTLAVFLLQAPLAALTVAAAASALPGVLLGLELPDARSSAWDLARLAGWDLRWTDESYSGAVVTDASGTATFHFDESARITRVEGTLTEPAAP